MKEGAAQGVRVALTVMFGSGRKGLRDERLGWGIFVTARLNEGDRIECNDATVAGSPNDATD